MIKLHHIDCMAFMREAPDRAFDLAIVDPPYGINATRMNMGTHLTRHGDGYPGESYASRLRKGRLNSGGGTLKNRALNRLNCEWDFAPPPPEYFRELFRVSKHQIIWGGNYFPLPPSRGIICWDKLQPWENFSQFEMAWTSFDRPAAIFRYSSTGGANREKKIHPTQKPVALYKWLLTNYARTGWQIFDSHLGSASSALACHELGFDLTGCEIDEEYFRVASDRLERFQAQQLLPI